MAASNYYEVRCERCQTSFPPEAKRCIHCGGPLGAGLGRWLSSRTGPGPAAAHPAPAHPAAAHPAPAGSAPPGAPAPEEADEDELPFQRGGRIIWLVTAAIAIVLSALRSCVER